MAYGQPTYAPGCGGCRDRSSRNGLGFVPVGTITGIGIDLARKFIGGSKVTNCPGQPSGYDLGNLIAQLDENERTQLDAAFRKVKAAYPSSWSWYTGLFGLDLDRLAFNLAGGEDCRVSSTVGKAAINLVNSLLSKHPTGMAYLPVMPGVPDSTVYPIEGGPVVSPILASGPTVSIPPMQGEKPSTLDQLAQLLKDAARAGGSAARDTVVGGVYDALPAQQQQQVRASVIGSTFDDFKVPLLVGGGLLVALLAFRPKH